MCEKENMSVLLCLLNPKRFATSQKLSLVDKAQIPSKSWFLMGSPSLIKVLDKAGPII
jgi:hypothetical protein